MRIIGGTARGRKLLGPGKAKIRPTSDRAREALFNIVSPETRGKPVLDLFAGTGALGLEALSRGAATALFVDNHRQALDLVQKNIQLCGFSDRARIVKRDLTKGLSFLQEMLPTGGFSLIFADPPYLSGLGQTLLGEMREIGLVASEGLIVFEDAASEILPEKIGGLSLGDQRRYGDTGFWLYRPE